MRTIAIVLILASALALEGCAQNFVRPLDQATGEGMAASIHGQLAEAGIGSSSPDGGLAGTAAFEGMNQTFELLLKRLARSSDQAEQTTTLRQISQEMRRATGYLSEVRFCTRSPGARVRYRLIQDNRALDVPTLTNSTEPYSIPVGIYHIWAERGGQPTSPRTSQFVITKKVQGTIMLEEAVSSEVIKCP